MQLKRKCEHCTQKTATLKTLTIRYRYKGEEIGISGCSVFQCTYCGHAMHTEESRINLSKAIQAHIKKVEEDD